jgi:hypothetical protein
MTHESPQVGDVAENRFAHNIFVGDEVTSLKLEKLETPHVVSYEL